MITLEDATGASYPVLKNRNIGEKFTGGVVKLEWRDMQKDGEPVYKDDGVTTVKQLVVYLLTKESTMIAGIGGNEAVPQRGEIVRTILDRGGLAVWFRAKEASGINAIGVGHMVALNTTNCIRYAGRTAVGQPLTTNEEIEAWEASEANIRRTETLGRYGDIGIREAPPEDAGFVTECETTYHGLVKQPVIALEEPVTASAGGAAAPSDLW